MKKIHIKKFNFFIPFLKQFNINKFLSTTTIFDISKYKYCNSCGIRLQFDRPEEKGFFKLKNQINTYDINKKNDNFYNDFINSLGFEDKKLLINQVETEVSEKSINNDVESIKFYDKTIKEIKSKSISKQILQHEKLNVENTLECLRCNKAKYSMEVGEKYDVEFPVETLENVIKVIPLNLHLIYIISLNDFPMTLNPDIFKYRKPNQIKFIATKSDLLFKNRISSINYGRKFIQDYLFHKFKVPTKNVLVVSGLINWNIDSVFDFIEDSSYVFGTSNCGKSTIIQSLLYYIHKNSKSGIRFFNERLKDLEINNPKLYAAVNQKRKIEAVYKNIVGPGVSSIPGYTRNIMPFKLSLLNKTIYDVPGFNNENFFVDYDKSDSGKSSKFLSSLMSHNPKLLTSLTKGKKTVKNGLHNSHYITVKNDQCLYIGGFAYLIFPHDSMFQIKKCINIVTHTFSNFFKAIKVTSNINDSPAIKKKKFIDIDENSIKNFKRYIIPPFFGTIDLVLKNLGYIIIKPLGEKKNNHPLILYLNSGIESIIRQPILNYLLRTMTGFDKDNNILEKSEYLKKSTFKLKTYKNDTPFYSKLIKSSSMENNVDKLISFYLKLDEYKNLNSIHSSFLENDYIDLSKTLLKYKNISFDASKIIDEDSKYDCWIE